MRKIMLSTLAAAAILSGGAFGNPATAMMVAPPRLSSAPKANALPIQHVTNICGMYGCAPVMTKRIVKPPRSFTTKAVPLAVSGAPAVAPAPAAASTKPWPLNLLLH